MIFSPHKDFIIAVYLFEPDPKLYSGTERSSFSDKFRRPGPEPSVLSVNLAGSGPVMFFIDSRAIANYTCSTGYLHGGLADYAAYQHNGRDIQ